MSRAQVYCGPKQPERPPIARDEERLFVPTLAHPPRATSVRAFVKERLSECVSTGDEVHVLIELAGEADARDALIIIGDRLLEALSSIEFEDEIRHGPDMASLRLRRLAALRVRINASAIADDRRAGATAILRRIEDLIHADGAAMLARRAERQG